ncbi:MAG: HD domain-containing protein [Chitinophagaceae bacterium]|nr:HD domain-containing protein [Chitinophagaceae bacterium]MBK8785865.1 HD domain-containing protein [Chitinophagaceae bacterium]MBL0199748.1 HD domain-containing protein [Chitinophagaceae bacterium]
MPFRKIINDPVYGFITIDDELIYAVFSHPYFQRLRRISQMAMANLVYPGAVHSRLHHALGAYHLMSNALSELKNKGIEITAAEEQAAKIAILLHDVGHGPFSHALEHILVESRHHEELSLMIIQELNKQFDGKLGLALEVFTDRYHKKFLYQLISGQLDVDRLDYLTRDSFFSGVNEGVIGYDRIIKMLTVHNGELMVEEKSIYSIEKFLVARRLMYWQVYLHKTVLCAEQMLKRIIKRAKHIKAATQQPLHNFITQPIQTVTLEEFCNLDDYDVTAAIKGWCHHEDKILSTLCKGIINRQLLKVQYFANPVDDALLQEKLAQASAKLQLGAEDAGWLVFTGEVSSSTYNLEDEHIHILFKDGTVKDISEVDNALINQNLMGKVKKYYICYTRS